MAISFSGRWFNKKTEHGWRGFTLQDWLKMLPSTPIPSNFTTGDVIPMTVDRTTVEEEGMGLTFSNYAAKFFTCDEELLYLVNISKQ
jgi:hypothetical protein